MADGQKRNIPFDGYGIGMSFGLRPHDIRLQYSASGILRFYPSSMWSCFYTWDCIKIPNGHVMTVVVPCQDPLNVACCNPLIIHSNNQWLVFRLKWHLCGIMPNQLVFFSGERIFKNWERMPGFSPSSKLLQKKWQERQHKLHIQKVGNSFIWRIQNCSNSVKKGMGMSHIQYDIPRPLFHWFSHKSVMYHSDWETVSFIAITEVDVLSSLAPLAVWQANDPIIITCTSMRIHQLVNPLMPE